MINKFVVIYGGVVILLIYAYMRDLLAESYKDFLPHKFYRSSTRLSFLYLLLDLGIDIELEAK